MSLAVTGAAQVLRPPEDGLALLRHDRAEELRLDPVAILCAEGRIAAMGDAAGGAATTIDARGGAIVPGFVDCHTHLPFAGWRAEEYLRRVAGVPYAQLAAEGGGIASSARALAGASDADVLAQAVGLAREALVHGTTWLELKSGYGLGLVGERRQLALGRALAGKVTQGTTRTALLFHAVPPGVTAAAWIDEVDAALGGIVRELTPDALDVFVEHLAFDLASLERIGALARHHDLVLRVHAEQLSTTRSVGPAIAAGARSVDHLSALHPDDVVVLAASECAAVLLPTAEVLGNEGVAPGRALADAGAVCVLATDLNPGTSPVASLPLVAGLAVRRYGWTVREALLALTLNAAWVVGASGQTGSIEAGKRADLLVLDGPVEHLPYRLGHNPVAVVVVGGEIVWARPDQAWRVRSA